MSNTISSLLQELTNFENSVEKAASVSASNSPAHLATWLDKMAEEVDRGHVQTTAATKTETNAVGTKPTINKEASMNDATIQKLAEAISQAIKTAVLDTPETQGSTVGTPHAGDGAAVNAARATDQIISATSVETATKTNPQRHNISDTFDMIEDEVINSDDLVHKIKEGNLHFYTTEEAQILSKFASHGYNMLVNSYSEMLAEQEETLIKQAAYEQAAKKQALINYIKAAKSRK